MPDEIQLPEGVVEELAIWHYCLTHEGGEKHGTPWIKASEEEKEKSRKQARDNLGECIPAIIAQEREKWEAEQEVELALLGVEKCSGEGIGFHNARAEKAKDERDKAKAQALAELREGLLNGKRYERTGQRLLIEQDGGEWFHARDVLATLSALEASDD